MQTAEIKARLARVQASSVQVKLREKQVVNGVESSGLWPRVTLRFDDREETVSLTDYADLQKEEQKKGDRFKLTKLEVAVLRVMGVESRSMRSVKRNAGLIRPLQDAVQRVQMRISSAISKARTTKKLGTRVEAAQRKKRKSAATLQLERSFRDVIFRGRLKLNDLKGSQIADIWDRIRMEKVVQEVHDL
jgi:hypothetical protein